MRGEFVKQSTMRMYQEFKEGILSPDTGEDTGEKNSSFPESHFIKMLHSGFEAAKRLDFTEVKESLNDFYNGYYLKYNHGRFPRSDAEWDQCLREGYGIVERHKHKAAEFLFCAYLFAIETDFREAKAAA